MKVSLSNKFYDILKFVALYVLPGLAALYFGLAGIWGLPYPEQIVGTIMAIDTFLGAVLGLAMIEYKKVTSKVVAYRQASYLKPNEKLYTLQMSNKAYDVLYFLAQILFPAIGTLYFALASIWHFPYGEQVVGTIALIDTFLGIFLGVNTSQYRKFYPAK